MEQFLRSLTYQFHDSYIDQKLIDADINHKYNVASRSLINFFIVNFLHYFPNFFHLDELIKKITDNLNEITLINLEDKPSVFGFYRMTEKKIKINQNFNKLDDFIKLDIGLFHEFIHAITELSSEYIKQSDTAFIEMMTTLFEEEYHIRKYGKIDKRINTYIPIYVRELYMIYGEDLLKEFLIHKSNIRHLLNIDDYHYENLKNNFTVIATEKVKKEMDFNVIEHTHIELEKTILKILENYLLNSPLTFCEKVEKINCIIQDQQKPDKKIIHNILIHAFSVQERQCLPLELKQYLSMKDITLIKKDIDFYAVADDFRFSQSPIISAKEHQLQVDMELIQYILYGDKNFLQKRKAFAKMKL